uniref:class I SAM-dependent methyltransferase n=1 Tax=Altererythrobacter segetis TaxID=1104773 RepID=UPI00140AADC1|nr:class I SAM-dependent methyltransferase [Altererythrobacter segetis]
MTLSARFAAQLAHPRGLPGRLLGQAMDLANGRPLRLAIEALEPMAGERILDAGCGTGAALAAVAAKAECQLYGIDRSAAMIAVARSRLGSEATLACSAIEALPRSWLPFDAVLALNVLYFADARGAMVAALHRSLRDGGRLIAYVTHRKTMERWRFARSGLHRLYDARELQGALVEGGFAAGSISIKDEVIAPGIVGLIVHAER